MRNIAILGFGVVGGGVARLLTDNEAQTKRLSGDEINIKYILDLRDFPGSPFEDRIIHDYSVIVSDPEVDTVIEVMGGSHPAYEFTVAAIKAGKNVITSNKEVVANFGDEFLALAKKMGVSYRFEAAVGGGIPVISPLIGCVLQNEVSEVRGILNGTTNYILTKMFTFGDSFDAALADAQARGYAERNPDADILGYDACRKIAILTAIVTGKLYATENIYTEGITKVRLEDVKAAALIDASIKLVGRCVIEKGKEPFVMVAPHLVPNEMPLSSVSGVYNAVEVVGEPIGNIMFYGQGAGAGATASAVVGDLMQVIASGVACAAPVFERTASPRDFGELKSAHYIAMTGVGAADAKRVFGNIKIIPSERELTFITEPITERQVLSMIEALGGELKARIRILK